MLSVGQTKTKKPIHRSRSLKNEKHSKIFNESDKNNHDNVHISKRTSKSVTRLPHRSRNYQLNEIQFQSNLHCTNDTKQNCHDEVQFSESVTPLSIITSTTTITSPLYYSKFRNHKLFTCEKMEGGTLSSGSSLLLSSSSSSTITTTTPSPKLYSSNGYFFTPNSILCNNEHLNLSIKDSLQLDSSNDIVNNSECVGSSSVIHNIKSIFNRFVDSLRNRNNFILSNSISNSNNSGNSNNNHRNISNTVKINANCDKISTDKLNRLQIPWLTKFTTQEQNRVQQAYTPTSTFITDGASIGMTSVNCTDVIGKHRKPNSFNRPKEDRIQDSIIVHEQNNEICNKQNLIIDNVKAFNQSEPTTQAQYTNTTRDVIQFKENRRRQPDRISCFTTHSSCFCHIHELNPSKTCHNNYQLYPCHSNCNHYHNENSLLPDTSSNFNPLKSTIKDNSKLPYRSNTLHIKSSNTNNPVKLKHTTSSHYHYVKHCSPSLNPHYIPVHRMMSSSPPFTLKHLSTIRNMYEQYEYSTKVNHKNYIIHNEISNIDDQSESDFSSPQLSPCDRPRFYSSNMILLKPPNHHPCMKLKYITEQILLAKSVFDVNQLKKRSNSWSVHRGFNLNSSKCERSSNLESEDEFSTCGTGRPSDCEFNIPFNDIKLLRCLQKGERKAIYKGQWHGEVDVHIFEDLSLTERKRFWQDVTRLMMTRHENIALFMGVCVDPPSFAIVTSASKGVSLYNKLHIKREKLSLTMRIYLLRQLANAMTYLHSRNNPIIIRRLSSKNIFLKPKMNLYLMDYSMVDCDYQIPDHVPIPLDGVKYIAPELLLNIKKAIEKLCENNCQSTLKEPKLINTPGYLHNKPHTSIHLFNIHKSRLHYNLTTMKSSIYNPQYINLFKSWSDLSKTIDYPQLTKYISLPNIYLSEQISMYPNEMSKNDKSIQSISPRKVSFIKTIRQFISRSEQKKLLFKCVHIPVTEFTTFSDIFAFGTIIFEINTRCYPYEELDLCHCIKYLLDGQRDDGRAYCIPSYMKILMCKCWSNDPSKRPSMNKITQELTESHGLNRRKNSDPVH
ncbi:unnamed protein product [Schistosoma rodhaini]|nr:unnamed protein product [Schistosoma rodhaini]